MFALFGAWLVFAGTEAAATALCHSVNQLEGSICVSRCFYVYVLSEFDCGMMVEERFFRPVIFFIHLNECLKTLSPMTLLPCDYSVQTQRG